MLVGNLENSWEFDLSHSQPGIGWEFVKICAKWSEIHKEMSGVRKMEKLRFLKSQCPTGEWDSQLKWDNPNNF